MEDHRLTDASGALAQISAGDQFLGPFFGRLQAATKVKLCKMKVGGQPAFDERAQNGTIARGELCVVRKHGTWGGVINVVYLSSYTCSAMPASPTDVTS